MCASCRLTRAWSAASPGTVWWWPTQSAAVTTVEAGDPSVTPVHRETRVSKLHTQLFSMTTDCHLSFLLSYKDVSSLYSEMFTRLCEMHLETESDGEQDFLPAFANYNPGKTKPHLCQYTIIWQTHWSIYSQPTLTFLSPSVPHFLFSSPVCVTVKGDSSEEDSDECSCANGRCVRSYLGTMCECNPGFRLDHSPTRCIGLYLLVLQKYYPYFVSYL